MPMNGSILPLASGNMNSCFNPNSTAIAVSIGRSFERLEERIDAAESRIYSRCAEIEDKIEAARQDLDDKLGDVREDIKDMAEDA